MLRSRYTHTLQCSNMLGVAGTLHKLGSGRLQHSNNRSLMMYRLDLGSIYNIRKRWSREFQDICLLIVCSVHINSSSSCFLLDKSNMVNHVPYNDLESSVYLALWILQSVYSFPDLG
jgi:hypothetical protein